MDRSLTVCTHKVRRGDDLFIQFAFDIRYGFQTVRLISGTRAYRDGLASDEYNWNCANWVAI